MKMLQFKDTQWKNFLERIGKSPLNTVHFWKRIGRLSNKKRPGTLLNIVKDGIEYNTDKEKAKVFAERLEAVFSKDDDNKFDKKHKENIYNDIM